MKNLKIFGVDDDQYYLNLFKQQLLGANFTSVETFVDGFECLKRLEERPDVIFLDYKMETISGFDLLTKIKLFDPSIFVVMLSGQERIKTAVETLKNGAFDYLQKGPDDFNKIYSVLERIMDQKSSNLIALKKRNADLENLIQERTEEILIQKRIIEEKNQNITSSIEYALRIQSAILKSNRSPSKILKNYFLYNKPKDIVSGDFTFFTSYDAEGEQIKDEEQTPAYVIAAVADCTGHGVPGALMSMIGYNGLNYAISKGLKSGEILNRLSQFIEGLFTSEASLMRDGMDIALCIVDIKNKSISYSGANNQMYLIRKTTKDLLVNSDFVIPMNEEENNGLKLFMLHPNKRPIGIYEVDANFSTQTFDYQDGDRIYLFTDGIVDQFGGEKVKRYSNKRFRSYLIENQLPNIQDQKASLENEFQRYKGNLEQIDDVCVMGIEL